MTTIRIILFRSSNEGAWFLSRKARELIDYCSVTPAELCFVYDCVKNIRLFASSLLRHKIPFSKLETATNIQKERCILINLNSFCNTGIFHHGYLFLLLSRRLEERIALVRSLKDQHIRELYLVLCNHAYLEGEDLSFLLNCEMVMEPEWRDPGVVYFQKENDSWGAYWQGIPRWMVPELLVRIADALAKHQEGFLERGFSGMAALTMKEIASTVGCVESSVSRIISGVEAETPWGRLPLKCLFSQKVPSTFGFTSQTNVIEKVAKLIDTEDKRKPLSDEDIAKIMRLEGINIARRTIHKYRQKLGIPSSSDRKKKENNSQITYPDGKAKKTIPIDTPNRGLYITSKKSNNKSKESCPVRPIPAYKAGLYDPTEDWQLSESNSKPPFIPVHRRRHSRNFSNPAGLETTNPIDAEFCIESGKRFEEDGRYELAIEEYEKAIALNPHDGRAHLGAGLNSERIGKREQAVRYYRMAIELGNNEALEFLRSMGIE